MNKKHNLVLLFGLLLTACNLNIGGNNNSTNKISSSSLGENISSNSSTNGEESSSKIEIKDISKTHHCPLAHMLRKRLHKMGIKSGFYAVFSPEPIREGAMILCEEQNKKSNVGTISYIPAVFGCVCAQAAVQHLMAQMKYSVTPSEA